MNSPERISLPFCNQRNIHKSWIIILASFLMLLLFWGIVMISMNLAISLKSFLQIHRSVSVWLVDCIPFLLFWIIYVYEKKINQIIQEKENYIRENLKLYKSYAQHAMNLGMSNFDHPVVPKDEADELGKSLKYLQGVLKATNRKELVKNWMSEGKEMISGILRIHNSIDDLSHDIIDKLCGFIQVEQGAIYLYDEEIKNLKCISLYAYNKRKFINQEFRLGQGLVGQCAYEMDFIYRTEIPDDYVTISSGILGDQQPGSIVLIPLISEEKLQGVMEFASIQLKISKNSIQFLLEMGEIIARTFYNLKINRKTSELLEEARKMTRELQANEIALQHNAEIMKKTQLELEHSNQQLEIKIKEAENAHGKLYWLLENASELISIYDISMRIIYVSPSVKKILGYSEEEFIHGKNSERLTMEGAQALTSLIRESAVEPSISRSIQYTYDKKDGETIFLESSARNMLHDPSINGIIVNTRDVTESIRALKEEALKTRMQSLSENSMDLIIRISLTGEFHYANPVVEDYTGMPPDTIIKKNLSELHFSPELKEYFDHSLAAIKSNPVKMNEELSLSIKLGGKITERIINFVAIPEYNQKDLETILLVGHDITEAKRIEKELQEKNKNIRDSINYSRKIQTTLLPGIDNMVNAFPHCFMLFKPRDIISGDFPWFYRDNYSIYIAAADCTGHGVPGSMLSVIAFFLLNDVVKKSADRNAGEICDQLHEQFRITLKQDSHNSDTRDGLDIALCKIRNDFKQLEFAGAHRPLYLLRDKELTEFKGNRKAIGGLELFKKADEKFVNYSVDIQPRDKLFFFTDGLTDQLGGPYGRKYTPNRVRNLILENPGYTMMQYQELFEKDFEQWMQNFRQLDDVLMIGIEF